MGWNSEDRGHLSIIDLLRSSHQLEGSLPDRNGDRVAGVLSCSNELPNVFLERSRWLGPLHENILQAGQHLCYSAPNELLQGGRDTWRKCLG